MTGSIALQQPVNRFEVRDLIKKKNKKQNEKAKKSKEKQRYFVLPDHDELTLTELLLITQYRFFRG